MVLNTVTMEHSAKFHYLGIYIDKGGNMEEEVSHWTGESKDWRTIREVWRE